jgi:hypothetical protein
MQNKYLEYLLMARVKQKVFGLLLKKSEIKATLFVWVKAQTR